MGRIVELLVGLNALGGIAVFLGFRHAGRKATRAVRGVFQDEDEHPTQGGTAEPPPKADSISEYSQYWDKGPPTFIHESPEETAPIPEEKSKGVGGTLRRWRGEA